MIKKIDDWLMGLSDNQTRLFLLAVGIVAAVLISYFLDSVLYPLVGINDGC